MESKNIENILNEMPAVICTAGSNIIAVQGNVPHMLSDLLVGRELFDYMEPCDIVRFSAHFYADNNDRILSFPINGLPGTSSVSVLFKRILDRRYAVAFLCDEDNKDKIRDMLSDSVARFSGYELVSMFTNINDAMPAVGDTVETVDAVGVTEYLCDHGYCSNLYIRTINGNTSGDPSMAVPLNIPRSAFIQLVMLIISILDAVSLQRVVKVKACKLDDSLEMRFITGMRGINSEVFHTGDIIERFPQSALYVSLAEYICQLYNASMDAFSKESTGELFIVLTFYDDIQQLLDFKSCDYLDGIETDICRVLRQIDLIRCKEEEQV